MGKMILINSCLHELQISIISLWVGGVSTVPGTGGKMTMVEKVISH